MKRILALDYGRRRVGVAISDPLRIFAQGLEVLHIRGKADLLGKVSKYFNIYEIEEVVIGNPLSKNGSESRLSEEIKKIANLINKSYNIKITLWDERFTTKEAETSLKEFGSKKFDKHKDKISAQLILQSYLERLRYERLS